MAEGEDERPTLFFPQDCQGRPSNAYLSGKEVCHDLRRCGGQERSHLMGAPASLQLVLPQTPSMEEAINCSPQQLTGR